MRLLRTNKAERVFLLNPVEKEMLIDILELYPCVPPGHHRHRLHPRSGADDTENQRLLDEALAEQRADRNRQLQALLQSPATFRATQKGFELRLRHTDCEWLMQVLNDVRVGSWIALGEPEDLPRKLPRDATKAAHACTMEIAGLFEMTLLEAMEGNAGL